MEQEFDTKIRTIYDDNEKINYIEEMCALSNNLEKSEQEKLRLKIDLWIELNINKFPVNEQKIRIFKCIDSEWTMSSIVKKIDNYELIKEMFKYISSNSVKEELIKSINDNKMKVELLSFIDNSNKRKEIILKFKEDILKYECLNLLTEDIEILEVIEKIIDEKIKLEAIFLLKNMTNKCNYISFMSNDDLKMQALEKLIKENISDYDKTKIILSIQDENTRYNLIDTIEDIDSKIKILQSLNENLLMRYLSQTTDSRIISPFIDNISDENIIVSLFKYINSITLQQEAIKKVKSDELKYKLLEHLKYDEDKVSIIKTITDQKLKVQALNYLKNDYEKFKMLLTIDSDEEKLNFLDKIESDFSKCELISTFKDDYYKMKAIEKIDGEYNKSKIIINIADENLRYESIKLLSDTLFLSEIIESFKTKEIKYKIILELESDNSKKIEISKLTDDEKYEILSYFDSDEIKADIIFNIENPELKLKAYNSIQDDLLKTYIIKSCTDENLVVEMLQSLQNNENKIKIITTLIKSSELQITLLKQIDNYSEILINLFKKGMYEYLTNLDSQILKELFDNKQIIILDSYSKIENESAKIMFSKYVSNNYDEINVDKINYIIELIKNIKLSNSRELQTFGDSIIMQSLKYENPIEYIKKIEEIFLKNDMPYVGKVFKIFKLLHTSKESYENNSPVLNRFKGKTKEIEIMDLIIFNDLLKCAIGSNNRSLKEFIKNIEIGNNILMKLGNNLDNLSFLSNEELYIINDYITKIELLLNEQDNWKKNSYGYNNEENLKERIATIINKLNIDNLENLPDTIVKNFVGIVGIDSFNRLKEIFITCINQTDEKNRMAANHEFTLEVGDFVKGINDVKFLPRILQNGSVSKEFLGESSDVDATPLDTDLSRILPKHLQFKEYDEKNIGNVIFKTISGAYGNTWLVLKNNPNKMNITRDEDGIDKSHDISGKFSHLEVFKTLESEHYGIRTGFPASEISYIVTKDNYKIIGLEIAMNGFYIPVIDVYGNLVFSPKDYDELRQKMSGLSYYDEFSYNISNNLITPEIDNYIYEIENGINETNEKRNIIYKKIKDAIEEFGLKFKIGINGDLSDGIVELIDTGSTGRNTNIPGTGDFDFMMRLDRNILEDENKLSKLKNMILEKLGDCYIDKNQITGNGDFRLKDVNIKENIFADIDITFTTKTDKMAYTTDMCIVDRLETIKKYYPDKYNYVIANIILAKKVLKEAEAYKPNRGENPQGGLGGVGVENWILQNGGSFVDAAINFLQAADGKNFEEFKKSYEIWDFGENFLAEARDEYPHDNFVTSNMSQSGYLKMVNALKKYLNYNINLSETNTNNTR